MIKETEQCCFTGGSGLPRHQVLTHPHPSEFKGDSDANRRIAGFENTYYLRAIFRLSFGPNCHVMAHCNTNMISRIRVI